MQSAGRWVNIIIEGYARCRVNITPTSIHVLILVLRGAKVDPLQHDAVTREVARVALELATVCCVGGPHVAKHNVIDSHVGTQSETRRVRS
jgi:hypothetical protein